MDERRRSTAWEGTGSTAGASTQNAALDGHRSAALPGSPGVDAQKVTAQSPFEENETSGSSSDLAGATVGGAFTKPAGAPGVASQHSTFSGRVSPREVAHFRTRMWNIETWAFRNGDGESRGFTAPREALAGTCCEKADY